MYPLRRGTVFSEVKKRKKRKRKKKGGLTKRRLIKNENLVVTKIYPKCVSNESRFAISDSREIFVLPCESKLL